MTAPLTSTVIMLDPSAADSDAATGAALPINLSNLECCPFTPRRSTQLMTKARDRQPRAQTNRLLLAAAEPAPPATATEHRPLSP